MASRDFTKGDERSQIIAFAAPIFLGNLFMQLYNYVDAIIVGRYIGKVALAAVGASGPLIFMLVSLVIGVGIGSTIVISQKYGAGDIKGLRSASDSLFIFLAGAAVVLTVLGISFSDEILAFIKLPSEVIPQAKEYLDIYLLSLIFMFVFQCLTSILRGVGDSKTPLIFLGVSTIINIVMDLVLVIVFDMGIKGVAWASVISQAIAVIFAINYVNRQNAIIKFNPFNLRFDGEIFKRQIKLGLPAGLQQLSLSIGMLAILTIINSFGTDVVAAYSAASKIETFIFVIPMTLNMALTNFVGQNYGAARLDRIDRGVTATVRIAIVMSFTILLVLSALSRPLMMMFTSDENIILLGCNYLIVLAVGYPIFNIMYSYMGAIRGMGNTIIPMLITLLTLWIIRVPIASVLSGYMAELGIWIASPISWAIGFVATLIAYRYIRKKSQL